MFRWIPFPFIRYTICLIIGILLYDQFETCHNINWLIGFIVSSVVYVPIVIAKVNKVILGVFGLSLMVILGLSIAKFNDHQNERN